MYSENPRKLTEISHTRAHDMKLLLILSLSAGFAAAAENYDKDDGNWYCQSVQRIAYKDVGDEGSYDRVTSMDDGNGQVQV